MWGTGSNTAESEPARIAWGNPTSRGPQQLRRQPQRPDRSVHRTAQVGELGARVVRAEARAQRGQERSEEHTSELQSPSDVVCRLPLQEKKPTRREQNRPNKR